MWRAILPVLAGLLSMGCSLTSAGQSLTVTYPIGGEAWQTSTANNITWTSEGVNANVRLELLQSGRLKTVIAADVANSGLYTWNVPEGLPDAADYRVRITATDGSATGESPEDFSIGAVVVTLTMSSVPDTGGATDPAGTLNVIAGVYYPVVATPIDGYTFSGWTVPPTATILDSGAEETYLAIRVNSAVTAGFKVMPVWLFEDFEDGEMPPDNNWDVIKGNSSPGDRPAHWAITSEYAPDTTNVYRAICPWGENLDEWLVLPTMDFSLLDSPRISFEWESSYFWSVYPNPNADFSLNVSVNGGASWTKLWSFSEIGYWPDWTWQADTVDLSQYAGRSVLLAFRVTGGDNADVVLDDIIVQYYSRGYVISAPIRSLSVSMGNAVFGKDRLTIRDGALPEIAFEPDTATTVTINAGGYSQVCGNLVKKGNNYVSAFTAANGTKVRLTINPRQHRWSFTANAAYLFGVTGFESDSTSVFLEFGKARYGQTLGVVEKTNWRYSTRVVGDDDMVYNLNGQRAYPTLTGANKDSFSIPKAVLEYPGVFDPATDTVTLKIRDWTPLDGVTLTLKSKTAQTYAYQTAKDVKPALRLKIDLIRKLWSFSASSANCALVKGPVLPIELRIGDYTQKQTVRTVQKTNLTYPQIKPVEEE